MATRTVSNKEIEIIKKWLENNQDSKSETITKDLEDIIANEFQTEVLGQLFFVLFLSHLINLPDYFFYQKLLCY